MRKVKHYLAVFLIMPFLGVSQICNTVLHSNFKESDCMGYGIVTKLCFSIYSLQLWAKDRKFSYDNLMALHAEQKRDVTQKQILDETLTKIGKFSNIDEQDLIQFESYLKSIYPEEIKKDETWTVIYIPNETINFYFNGKLVQKVPDMKFAKAFFEIWLSEEGEFQSLRSKLLQQ